MADLQAQFQLKLLYSFDRNFGFSENEYALTKISKKRMEKKRRRNSMQFYKGKKFTSLLWTSDCDVVIRLTHRLLSSPYECCQFGFSEAKYVIFGLFKTTVK